MFLVKTQCSLTEDGLVAPQVWYLLSNQDKNGQIEEPDQVERSKLVEELQTAAVMALTDGGSQLHQEPNHDDHTESNDKVAWPCVPLIYIRYYVHFGLQEYMYIENDVHLITVFLLQLNEYLRFCISEI